MPYFARRGGVGVGVGVGGGHMVGSAAGNDDARRAIERINVGTEPPRSVPVNLCEHAGGGAFIGPLWAVRSTAEIAFAEEFDNQFVDERQALGMSSLVTRRAIQSHNGDPSGRGYLP
jgi:hypothetical protein